MKMLSPFLFIFLLGATAHAQTAGGYDHGNGGDMCEYTFKNVRDNLLTWILKGGAADLRFPKGISLDQYNLAMFQKMRAAKVSCTDKQVFVGNAEKTCKNFVEADGTPSIHCNEKRFMSASKFEQYILVHHEYAGLAGFEVNTGEASNYQISDQILRSFAGARLKIVTSILEFIAKMAVLPEQESNGRAVKNNAICMYIGRINQSDVTQELYRDLISLDGNNSGTLFPESATTFSKLRLNIMGLMNYCIGGLTTEDPQPVPFQNAPALLKRIKEIQQQISVIEKYLDKRFPYGGRAGL
ncbi:hypothetical protein D3C72_1040970 [compost metagenome]